MHFLFANPVCAFAGQFRTQHEQREYVNLLQDLSACLSAKQALNEESKKAKNKEAERQKKLLAAGKYVQNQARKRLLQSPDSSTTPTSQTPNGKSKRLIDLVHLFR